MVSSDCYDTTGDIICHVACSVRHPVCCRFGGPGGNECLWWGERVVHTSNGYVPGCIRGTSYGTLDPFTATCARLEWGSICGVPYGPIQRSGPTPAYNCHGPCL